MRDVCHCAAPIAALNSSTFGKVGESATRPPSLGVAASRVGFSRCIMKGRVTEGTPWLWTLAWPPRGPHADKWLRGERQLWRRSLSHGDGGEKGYSGNWKRLSMSTTVLAYL